VTNARCFPWRKSARGTLYFPFWSATVGVSSDTFRENIVINRSSKRAGNLSLGLWRKLAFGKWGLRGQNSGKARPSIRSSDKARFSEAGLESGGVLGGRYGFITPRASNVINPQV